MHAVQSTSVAAYHGLTAKQKQTERIARYIITETKHARWAWIGKVSRELGMEKSTVSARMNGIKKSGITLDGQEYEMKFVKKILDCTTGVTIQAWALTLRPQHHQGQLKMF